MQGRSSSRRAACTAAPLQRGAAFDRLGEPLIDHAFKAPRECRAPTGSDGAKMPLYCRHKASYPSRRLVQHDKDYRATAYHAG
eukprot:8093-Eustigmatos_ZCMA.PRE.1